MNRQTSGVLLLTLLPLTLIAQQRDAIPLTNWSAPLYWQPSQEESRAATLIQSLAGNTGKDGTLALTGDGQTPPNSLVFVGMTPCRVVDTRNPNGPLGGPALIGNAARTFPIQSSASCTIPSIAQAYSFNITVVPFGFLDFITVWPTGQARPNASTVNGYVGTVIANAAIVPAGMSGSVDVYASQNTHFIVDINGYYAAQSGITLAQGSSAAPSLSFTGDPGTGLFSSGASNLSIATGGTSRVDVASNGNVGIGTTTTPGAKLHINAAAEGLRIQGASTGAANLAYATFVDSAGNRTGYVGDASSNDSSTFLESDSGDVALVTAGLRVLTATSAGNVGIGTANPQGNLHVSSTNTGATSLTLENLVGQTSRQLILSNYGSTGGGLYWANQDSANTSSLLGPNLFVLRSTGGLAFSGSSTAEHMRIAPDGRVGIGTILPSSNAKLHVEGGANFAIYGSNSTGTGVLGGSTSGKGVAGIVSDDGYGVYGSTLGFGYAGYFQGNVHVTGTVTQGSDARLKQNISNLRYGLPEILHLRPVTFAWKQKPYQGVQLGLIAQEVETVLPELVATDKDEEHTKGINYIGLVPVTIKAIQEQQSQIEAQKKLITEQQEQNRKLEERLAALEALLGKVSAQAASGQE